MIKHFITNIGAVSLSRITFS